MNMDLISLTSGDFDVTNKSSTNSNVPTHWPRKSYLHICRAIKNQPIEYIKCLLADRSRVNVPLRTDGRLAGYTILHMACMHRNRKLVNLLVDDYHADVNVVANDGAQPIHLACIFGDDDSAEVLLEAGANVDAEIDQDLFSKYKNADRLKYTEWYSDFGDKMTILTFAILYSKSWTAELLIEHDANLEVKSLKNKTLLMYVLENQNLIGETIIIKKSEDPEFINARDDDGFSAIHFLFHPKKYGDFRFDETQFGKNEEWRKALLVNFLISAGADIYATINGDPDTLVLNMAAYRSSPSVLKELLPHYEYITGSKALYYAMLPIEDVHKFVRLYNFQDVDLQLELLHNLRIESVKLILQDLVNRHTFGMPVPEGEKQLMNELIAKDTNVRDFVHNYDKNYIQGTLKNTIIWYDNNKSITFFDFISQSCNDKKLRLLVKNQSLMDAFEEFYEDTLENHSYFNKLLDLKIETIRGRVELLEKLRKIEQLRKFLPLPYELVLDISEYLNNQDLANFIHAFFSI